MNILGINAYEESVSGCRIEFSVGLVSNPFFLSISLNEIITNYSVDWLVE